MFKRFIILIPAVVLLLGIFSLFAFADSTIAPELQTEANQSQFVKAEIIKDVSSQGVINPELLDRAQKAGIDTKGLTNIDVKIKLQETWNSEFREKSQKYGIDTTNLSDEQVREKVLTIENADAIAKAKRAGIKTDGLTYSQVKSGIEEWDRENARNKFGINTNGMTYSQVIEAIQERSMEMAKMKEGYVNNASNNNEQLMDDLIISAKALGIEYQGLSYEELYEKVIEAKKASINNK